MSDIVGTVGKQTGTVNHKGFRIEYHDLIPVNTLNGSSQGWRFNVYSPITGNARVFSLLVTYDRYDDEKALQAGIDHVMGRIDNNGTSISSGEYAFAWSQERGFTPLL